MCKRKLLNSGLNNPILLQDSKQSLLVSEIFDGLYLLQMEVLISLLLMQVNMFQKPASEMFNFL
jgi:hypothetical protein